jgi:mono/diheme cytochrome c family protein
MDDENIQLVADWIDAGADCDGLADDDGGGSDVGDDGTTGGVDGATVYVNSCSGCHGANGEGVAGPNMVSAVDGLTAEDVADIALNGSGNMPAILTDPEEADAVGEYSVSEFGG